VSFLGTLAKQVGSMPNQVAEKKNKKQDMKVDMFPNLPCLSFLFFKKKENFWKEVVTVMSYGDFLKEILPMSYEHSSVLVNMHEHFIKNIR
jgi:hypothetical protein